MKRMGEEDVLFESLEFVRRPPGAPELQGAEPKEHPWARPQKEPPSEPPVVIFLSRLFERSGWRPPRATAAELTYPWTGTRHGSFFKAPGPPPPGEEGTNRYQAEAAARFAAEMVRKKAEVLHKVMESWGQLNRCRTRDSGSKAKTDETASGS